MNRPLRLTECSPRISRCVSLHYWQSVRSCRGPIYRTRVHEYPEIILRIYAVGITIRIISTYQNHLGCIEERARWICPYALRIVRCHTFTQYMDIAYCSLLYILHHKQMVWCVRWCVYLFPFTMLLVWINILMTTENEYNHIWKYTKIKREHNLNCVPPPFS